MKPATRKTLRRILVPFFAAVSIAGAASANTFFDEWPPGAKLFSESEMQPCEALWAKSLAISSKYWQQTIREAVTGDRKGRFPPPALVDAARRNLERSKSVSILEYARQSSWSVAKRDLGATRKDLKEVGEDLAVLQSGSDERIGVRFSVRLTPAELEERVTDRLTWQCTFNVRLAQLTTKSAPAPAATSAR